MQANCPKCPIGVCDYDSATTCKCDECGARFEVDPDGDWTGDHYQDTSSAGQEITNATHPR